MNNQDNDSFLEKNKKAVIGCVAVAFVFMLFLNSSSSPKPVVNQVENESSVFNIPSLVGLNIDELVNTLGIPNENTEPTEANLASGGTTEWEKTWYKGDYSLMGTYSLKDRKIINLFLSTRTDEAYQYFKNTSNILRMGNLSADSQKYSVEFVKAMKGDGYTGVIITKK